MQNTEVATTKDRILETTAELFRRYGYNGTGLKQIVAEANAPFGSVYHFFPGGKQNLGEEVIQRSGRMYQELVEAVFDAAPDVVTGTSDCFQGAAQTLLETDYADACPIATVALEVASTNEELRKATADVFERWIAAGTERFVEAGIPPKKARELMISMLCLLEGAFVLSRAMRSTDPLEIAGETATAAVRKALPEARTGARRRAKAR
jgi:AcrR family transcriptional regulator